MFHRCWDKLGNNKVITIHSNRNPHQPKMQTQLPKRSLWQKKSDLPRKKKITKKGCNKKPIRNWSVFGFLKRWRPTVGKKARSHAGSQQTNGSLLKIQKRWSFTKKVKKINQAFAMRAKNGGHSICELTFKKKLLQSKGPSLKRERLH